MVSAFDLLAGITKDNNEDRAQKIKERGEEIKEQRLLYQQIAMNRYATDERLYAKHYEEYSNKSKALSSLGSSATKDEIATKLAVLDGRNIDGADEKQRAFILQSYYGDIEEQNKKDSSGKDMLDADGNILKQLVYKGNHTPVAPAWGKKYYNSQTFFDAKDNIESGTKGKWTTAIRGEGFDTGDQVLATLQNDLETGAERNVKTWDEYFKENNNVFDAKAQAAKPEMMMNDLWIEAFSFLPVTEADKKGTDYLISQATINKVMIDKMEQTEQDALLMSIIRTIPNGEKEYVTSFVGGKLVLKGSTGVTRGQLTKAYTNYVETQTLKAMLGAGGKGDIREINLLNNNYASVIGKWFNDNRVSLKNANLFSESAAGIYLIPNAVGGHHDVALTKQIGLDLASLVKQSPEQVYAKFAEEGIALPNARELTSTSNFQDWQPYLDAYSNAKLTHQTTEIVETKLPASLTNDIAKEWGVPELGGISMTDAVTSADTMTADNTGMLILNPESNQLEFNSWSQIHGMYNEALQKDNPETAKAALDAFLFEGNNKVNESLKSLYPLVVDKFKLNEAVIDNNNNDDDVNVEPTISSSIPSFQSTEGNNYTVTIDGENKTFDKKENINVLNSTSGTYEVYGYNSNAGRLSTKGKLDTLNELESAGLLNLAFVESFNTKGIYPDKEKGNPITLFTNKIGTNVSTGFNKSKKIGDTFNIEGNTYVLDAVPIETNTGSTQYKIQLVPEQQQ